jgi:hypothetical protein
MCTIKGDDLITLSRDIIVASALVMPEPDSESHCYSTPSIRGQFVISRCQENLQPLLTHDPAVYATRQNLTPCQRAQRLT